MKYAIYKYCTKYLLSAISNIIIYFFYFIYQNYYLYIFFQFMSL